MIDRRMAWMCHKASWQMLVAYTTLLFASFDPVQAQEKPTPEADTFGQQLPRVPARSPQQSLQVMEFAGPFQAELVAGEPLVQDPVAIDIDEQGRMYVVQLPPYNAYALEDADIRGSIVRVEDTDGDGEYDRSLPFAEDLKYPTALACWDGGLFVGDAPDLLYLKDTDGDGRADQKQVVFTGFGSDKAGEAHLNSIRWGIDQRFHLSTSLSGGDVRAVAAEGTVAVSTRGRGLIFDPRDLTRFELTSGGGQHGMSMDNWGRKFVCSNSVPAQTLMYDDRYLARNPHLQAPAAAVDIAPEGKFTHLFRISPPEPWRVLRTRLRREGKFRGSDEGGKPFGFFTGASGVTIYRGDAWPEEYRGNLLVGDVANNLVYRAHLEESGVGLVALRADEGQEFVASRDIWFRPVQFMNAPDGTVYVLDMYRELIEGAAFLPPEFLDHLDAASGNDRGRIYRLVHKQSGRARQGLPKLGEVSSTELVAMLDHPNGWHRDTASRLLYQRQDRTVVAPLQQLVERAETEAGRATALHLLHSLGALEPELLDKVLAEDTPTVRIQALRVAEAFVDSPLIRSRLLSLTADPVLNVRYQLAFSLGAIPGPTTAAPLATLARRDGSDRWMSLAVLSSSHEVGAELLRQLAADKSFRAASHGKAMLVALASQIGAAGQTSQIAVVLQALRELPESEKSLREGIVQALVEKQSGQTRERILAAAGGQAAEILQQMLRESLEVAVNRKAGVTQRVDAIRSLRLANLEDVDDVLPGLLEPAEPQPVQSAALAAMTGFSQPKVAEILLTAWPSLSPTVRTQAAETLLSRPQWINAFLDAVASGDVARGDIAPARVQLLLRHPDPKVAGRVSKLFADSGLSARKAVVDRYQEALTLEADATRGKAVFKKNCSNCHRLEGVGTQVGAELKGIRQRGLSAVLLNILDPNREVKPEFLTYVVQTDDGRIETGMIASENANSLTLRRTDGTTVAIQRINIEALRSSGLSFMPEGLEKTIDAQQMADLLSYLNSVD